MVVRSRFEIGFGYKLTLLGATSWVLAGLGGASGAIASAETHHRPLRISDVSELDESHIVAPQMGEGGSSQTSGETVRFSTERYFVRVYRQSGQLLMDVFDRQSQRYLLQGNPTTLDSPPNAFWRTFRSMRGGLDVYARNDPNGNTELEIFSGGQQFYFGQGSTNVVTPQPQPQPQPPTNTPVRLSFNTNDYRVQVYQSNQQQLLMDVFDIRANSFLIRQSPAAIVPQQQTTATSRTYTTTQGALQVFASINANRTTGLELWNNGRRIYSAVGSNAAGSDVGGTGTGYSGNDFNVPAQARVIARTANLRSMASTTGAIVATLLECIAVTAIQKQYNTTDRYVWYLVDVPGQARGWIRGDLLEVEPTASCR
jgi:hypothetical protein